MQASLPQLLFQRCHLNCVDSDNFSAETPAEQSCIKNCQDKIYQSFDLYVGIQTRKEAQARLNVDKAAFIGMETEHSNDTSGEIREPNQKTIDVASVQRFTRRQQYVNRDLRVEAYNKN
mmetsp:Transcript_22445/g.30041  ORF Transcript_22445/g.30041 Transcript_22445/m.30041 type:complete len:119 (-) Transcript_22445:100-456(-)